MLPADFLQSRWLFQVMADRARHAIPSYPLADTWLASTTKLIVSKLLSTVMTVIVLAIPPCIAYRAGISIMPITSGIHRINWSLPIHCVPDLVHDGIPCCVTCHVCAPFRNLHAPTNPHIPEWYAPPQDDYHISFRSC